MTRNHFSKKGGPYFINDGFSKHDHLHKPGDTHEDIKPDIKVFITLTIGFVLIVFTIASLLAAL